MNAHKPEYTPQELILLLQVIVEQLNNKKLRRKDIKEYIRSIQDHINDLCDV